MAAAAMAVAAATAQKLNGAPEALCNCSSAMLDNYVVPVDAYECDWPTGVRAVCYGALLFCARPSP